MLNLLENVHQLDETSLLEAILEVEQSLDNGNADKVLQNLDTMIADLSCSLREVNGELQGYHLIHGFYQTLMFSSPGVAKKLTYQDCLLSQLVTHRTGSPICLGLLFIVMAKRLGVEAQGLFLPGKLLVSVRVEEREWVFNPEVGIESLQLQAQHEENDEWHIADCEELLLLYLSQLKTAALSARDYAQALPIVDILILLQPDDAYERRDRGFVLENLDCHHLAREDYTFFLEQCPEELGAELIKKQLEKLDQSQVFH